MHSAGSQQRMLESGQEIQRPAAGADPGARLQASPLGLAKGGSDEPGKGTAPALARRRAVDRSRTPKTRRDERDPSGRVAPLASGKQKPGLRVNVPRIARRKPKLFERRKGAASWLS